MANVFDPSFLTDVAARLVGSDDFGDPIYRPAFEALVGAMREDAAIDPHLARTAARKLIDSLMARPAFEHVMRMHPEIADVPIEKPVFIVGLPRSGTTLLHNVLAGHPQLRALMLWEMRHPLPPPDFETGWWEKAAIEEADSFVHMAYASMGAVGDFAAIHPMGACLPDECTYLLRYGFADMFFGFMFYIPSYLKWLDKTDMVPYYRYYRRLLQIMQWRKPGRRLLLKDPTHAASLTALLEVFPDAQLVMPHRTLTEAVPSIASFNAKVRWALGRRATLEPRQMGEYTMSVIDRLVGPVLGDALGKRVHHVSYRELAADPVATSKEICAAAGLSTDAAAIKAMEQARDTFRAYGAGKHGAGKHGYSFEEVGLTRDGLLERYKAYQTKYITDAP